MEHKNCPKRNPLFESKFVKEKDGAKRLICKACGTIAKNNEKDRRDFKQRNSRRG